MSSQTKIAVSSGEPAGIGPELCAHLAGQGGRPVIFGDASLLQQRNGLANVCYCEYQGNIEPPTGCLEYVHLPLAKTSVAGQLDAANADYVYAMLDAVIERTKSGEFAAIVTAPVHKGVLCNEQRNFNGHTEYLAASCGVDEVVMLLLARQLRVALATTHLPLRDVADAINSQRLVRQIEIIRADLKRFFGLSNPRILVAGLNPHAGEGGHLGREEIEQIIPAIAALQERGWAVEGPLPADTLFVPAQLARADAVLAMYHDQGLPVLKHIGFDIGVNLTLGLPIVRTSVDHGTALDLAGQQLAHSGSLLAAYQLALEIAQQLTQDGNSVC